MVGSFYDPELDEGCAFEELISFHGGLGGPQTRAFILAPKDLQVPEEPLVGAASVHALLKSWRGIEAAGDCHPRVTVTLATSVRCRGSASSSPRTPRR